MGRRKTKKRKLHRRRRSRKERKYKRSFVRDKCAPKSSEEKLEFSCYTNNSLHKLKKLWNARHPDNVISSNNPHDIWKALKYGMSRSCDRESCWLKQKIFREGLTNEMNRYTFAPEPPQEWKKKPYEWLTSVEMMDVMKQYEKAYNCFEFMGPSPIDFDEHKMFGECVWEDICQFDLKKLLKRGKTKIGIIFNLDPHYLEGSHWISIFIDTTKGEIYYFDSYGERPPKRVLRFMKKVQRQSKQLSEPFKIIQNRRRHQYSISECGMYCLYMIIELLKGGDFKEMISKRIKDKDIKLLRKKYFNN
jgi:hypothetical protein